MERHEVELEHETPGDDEEEYEREFRGDREAAAETLRALADGVAEGSVPLEEGPVVEPPEGRAYAVEVEYEREGGEHELEAEIEWHVPEQYGGQRDGESDDTTVEDHDARGGHGQDDAA